MTIISFRKFNIADWFSFYRIAASPVLLAVVIWGGRDLFAWLLLVSLCTDMVDGFLARRLKISSPRGSQLDSVGDQVTLIMAVAGVIRFEPRFMAEQYPLIALALGLYFLQMVIAFVRYGRATSFHTLLAKLSALMQGAFVLWLLFFEPPNGLFYAVIVLGVAETIEEITLIFLHREWRSDVRGLYWVLKRREGKARRI